MKGRKLVQQNIADAAGVSQPKVQRWLKGKAPDADELDTLADFFGVTTDDLLGRSAPRAVGPCPKCEASERRAEKAEAELRELKSRLRAVI